jgi:DNA-binding NarL/FixJ family response regulator
METIRVLIADDHEVVRVGIRGLLEESDFTVCGEVSNGREAVEAAAALEPDIIIMDLAMPELNGLEAARQIRQAHPRIEILILSMHQSEKIVRDVLSAGARGYVLKADAGRDLLAALEALAQKRPFFSCNVVELLLQGYLSGSPVRGPVRASILSPREREIIQLLAEGKSNKEVATCLNISVKTAETHRAHIIAKLDFHSVADLVHYALRNAIIEI